MTFRFALTATIALALGQAQAANHSIRVDAGQHDRLDTPVSFQLPKSGGANWQLTGPAGQALPVQSDERGTGTFILPKLAAFQTAVFTLSDAGKKAHAPAVNVARQGSRLHFTLGDRTVMHYQAEKSELPRADLEPIYRRGGYLHPIVTPDGTVITCLLYTSPSPRDKRQSRMPSSA